MTKVKLADCPPTDAELTAYDREHLKLYLRLLDAEAEGADWMEVAEVVLLLDPKRDAERARRIYAAHLARAKWMAEHGHSALLRSSLH
ncbi:DUF2285 domain-containing protein [Agrobacterium tumefaciens]|uniref:DNA -binding domain-containing protein n=1 Tax=Agrobacterium TaxID=357 RepID=UPI001573218D|nr:MULTISPECIES: DUF2285 domain-containing protein [Agrobacterium]MBO0127983.1 DUF2285 domain-containing protein [Agrobacterium sp. OT33]MCF1480228.1 DUF2285 domain-containing protein [Agrobacterium vitis]NTA46357.1 DUF2285 domain-containing protein [Agrobacterium tumefaciens]NTA48962.1 DUF2285 domain-containing protein [Agrobacterium tumefaciens]UXS41572.1 DUF2285 domain-containing protein [Agrobacterium tumefaciens]